MFLSHFWLHVRKTHSSLFPLPRSTEHSSLHIYIPHSSTLIYLCFKHQASLLAAFFSVRNGRLLALQLMMPYFAKTFLMVLWLQERAQAFLTWAYESFGLIRT